MAVIQIRMPRTFTRAQEVIISMERLLDARHKTKVSRRSFLFRWAKLRRALENTYEYRRLQAFVFKQNKGKCWTCNKAKTKHMHHKTGVARAPQLALSKTNVEGICIRCHKKLHPHMKRAKK